MSKQWTAFEHLTNYFKSNLSQRDLSNSLFDLEEILCKASYPRGLERSWLDVFCSVVQIYNFEPVVFTITYLSMSEDLANELSTMSDLQKIELLDMLRRVSKNIFIYDDKHNALDCLLRLYMHLNCFKECIELSLESLAAFGPIGTIFDHLAVCYEALNQFELANKYYQESLNLTPNHEWAGLGFERTKSLVSKKVQ